MLILIIIDVQYTQQLYFLLVENLCWMKTDFLQKAVSKVVGSG